MTGPDVQDNRQHVDELDKRLRGLNAALADLGNSDEFDQLLKIIHFRGWTTWPDLFLMNTVVEAMERAVDDVRDLRKALLECALSISDAPVD